MNRRPEAGSVASRASMMAWAIGSALCRGSLHVDARARARGRAKALREAFQRLGPAFIKLGQVISVGPGVFSPELAFELERLQEDLAARKRQIDMAREAVTTLKVRGAQLREKKEAASRALKRTEELVTDLRARITRHRQERERCGQERERLVAALAGGDGDDVADAERGQTLVARHVSIEGDGDAVRFARERHRSVPEEARKQHEPADDGLNEGIRGVRCAQLEGGTPDRQQVRHN